MGRCEFSVFSVPSGELEVLMDFKVAELQNVGIRIPIHVSPLGRRATKETHLTHTGLGGDGGINLCCANFLRSQSAWKAASAA